MWVNDADAAATAVKIDEKVVILPLLGIVLVHVSAHAPLAAWAPRNELHLPPHSFPRSSSDPPNVGSFSRAGVPLCYERACTTKTNVCSFAGQYLFPAPGKTSRRGAEA